MFIRKTELLFIFLLAACPYICAASLKEKFNQLGYAEIHTEKNATAAFDSLYGSFDEIIAFLKANPRWAQKLDLAKERFIRSKEKQVYATDFFGFYDESERNGRHQISFYYSTHFHQFICTHYPEFKQAPEIMFFFETCFQIQELYRNVFNDAAVALSIETIFLPHDGESPILFKVIKYLPSYIPARPHYDGTVLSLFLDSTDNQSLLLSPYKNSLSVDDFASPQREFSRGNSVVLIPGALLTDFSIYPTPHIVKQSGNVRYATIAFAMRPNHTPQKCAFSPLPHFSD